MYQIPHGTAYQGTHQRDEMKQMHPLVMSPVGHHWPHMPGTCQCLSSGLPCPQPAYGVYGYANQWMPITMIQSPQPHVMQMHAGPLYPRGTAYSVPLQSPASLSPYPLSPVRTANPAAYRPPHNFGEMPKYKSAQHQFGPPQKPLQSKHALWVGGISSDTHILQLRDHFFVPELVGEILSVVLMPQSHSGFVNFRTAKSCKAAAFRFNNSALNNAYIRCRCRRPSPDAVVPVANLELPSVTSSPKSNASPVSTTDSNFSLHMSDEDTTNSSLCSESLHQAVETMSLTDQDEEVLNQKSARYFLIKSLTNEELVASINSGRWATQSQNEAMLNEAYRTCDAVYLIFSINRSGEFFGYARMASAITADTTSAPSTQRSPSTSPPVQSEGNTNNRPPTTTFAASNTFKTPAKGTIPAGRIVDELYRGKVFWEILSPDGGGADEGNAETTSSSSSEKQQQQPQSPRITSFKVDWISLRRLPFWQTKHLLNAWNENKPVKVGRDGTELETEAGRKLCALFLGPSSPGKAVRDDGGGLGSS